MNGSSHRPAVRLRPLGGPRGGPMGPLTRPAEKPRNLRGTLIRLMGYLAPRRLRLLAVLILAVLSTAFSIVSPRIMGMATTSLFHDIMLKMRHVPGAGVDFGYILHILYILAALYLASAFFSYLQQWIMAEVAQRTVYDLRRDVNLKLARLPLKYFDTRTHGEVLSRVTNDIDNIASTLQQSLTQLITAVVTLAGVLIMMLIISRWLTLIYAVVLPLSALVTRAVASRSQKFFASQWQSLGELNGHVEEMYAGHQIVKAFGQEKRSIAKFEQINERLFASSWKAQFASGLIMPVINLINNTGYVLVCVVGGIFVAHRAITLGDVQAFIQYSRQFTHPIIQTANIINVIQSTIASAERVFEILDEPEEVPDKPDAVVLASPEGAVRFENVHFRYREDVPLLEDINFAVHPGQTIAIVGPTGAGKTTLVNLLMRFYDPDRGRITLDGVDIRDLKRTHLRSMLGMVLQDTWLFNGTIRDNIAYGRENATDEEVIQAARLAHADHFIRTLPDGYNTVLNEEASNISQGQKQLLTIARAILADPVVLILDEATSNVDTRTEAYIQKGMLALMKHRTNFVIAHRLSTIRDANFILVMDKGQIVEIGSHRELLARNGFYAELYNSQFLGCNQEEQAV